MDSYGWKVKLWKYSTLEEAESQKQAMETWLVKWQGKYQVRPIFVNNAYAVEYKLLIQA